MLPDLNSWSYSFTESLNANALKNLRQIPSNWAFAPICVPNLSARSKSHTRTATKYSFPLTRSLPLAGARRKAGWASLRFSARGVCDAMQPYEHLNSVNRQRLFWWLTLSRTFHQFPVYPYHAIHTYVEARVSHTRMQAKLSKSIRAQRLAKKLHKSVIFVHSRPFRKLWNTFLTSKNSCQ